jgi:hypothetical protein
MMVRGRLPRLRGTMVLPSASSFGQYSLASASLTMIVGPAFASPASVKSRPRRDMPIVLK